MYIYSEVSRTEFIGAYCQESVHKIAPSGIRMGGRGEARGSTLTGACAREALISSVLSTNLGRTLSPLFSLVWAKLFSNMPIFQDLLPLCMGREFPSLGNFSEMDRNFPGQLDAWRESKVPFSSVVLSFFQHKHTCTGVEVIILECKMQVDLAGSRWNPGVALRMKHPGNGPLLIWRNRKTKNLNHNVSHCVHILPYVFPSEGRWHLKQWPWKIAFGGLTYLNWLNPTHLPGSKFHSTEWSLLLRKHA